ncbi:hypothetical protein AB0C96_38895 [Streptomyces sp. NPDC048506]|uniref:hypothetical protein n=1 Tax=Streptomyces sp. NPDC048506 TaxID=3155028 RepID=UPI003449278F
MLPPDGTDVPHPVLPAEFVRYAVALQAPELAWGHLNGRLTAEDTVQLAFLRRCDLGAGPGEAFARIHRAGHDPAELAAVCREIADASTDEARTGRAAARDGQHAPDGQYVPDGPLAPDGPRAPDGPDARRVWDYLERSRRACDEEGAAVDGGRRLADGRREFLLDRAASGQGMNWQESSALLGTDRPEEVDAAFERGEELVGVAVIGLALTHPDAAAILPRVARALERALESSDAALRHQGLVALGHTARLHCTVDRRCLDLLRRCPRRNEADDDLWGYVARRRLPWWLWRHQFGPWLWQVVRYQPGTFVRWLARRSGRWLPGSGCRGADGGGGAPWRRGPPPVDLTAQEAGPG